MLTLTKGKKAAMDRLSTKEGVISALAIDQRRFKENDQGIRRRTNRCTH
jgi:hypothetical protein